MSSKELSLASDFAGFDTPMNGDRGTATPVTTHSQAASIVTEDKEVVEKPGLLTRILDAVGRAYAPPPGCEMAYLWF